jgi:hypothetical protein
MGTVKWKIEDDHGRIHTIILPGTYLATNAPARLLSPQHWAQVSNNHYPNQKALGALPPAKKSFFTGANAHSAAQLLFRKPPTLK